jgi:RNA polymerase sigma-70 factor (ECF subfamily)
MSSAPEKELIRRCRRGDAEAWDELFDRHYSATARFVFQLAHDFSWEDVEEICQEAFLAAIKHLDAFHGNSQFQTWVFRIAANKARDYRQKRQAAKRGGGLAAVPLNSERPDGEMGIDPPGETPGPDQVLMNTERAALLNRALEHLGDPCREIIQLRYFGDLSYDEISHALRMNAKTVSSRLSKCLDQLEALARPLLSGGKLSRNPSNH